MSIRNQPSATPPILVKASILENAEGTDFLDEIYTFVIDIRFRGRYLDDELPAHAIQFNNAYVYEMEINNGGHSQYIHNTIVRAGKDRARETFSSAHAGLVSMGASQQADILGRMIAWCDANPESADEQTGFEGGRDEELEPLDTEFYEANEVDPIAIRAETWIRAWADLQSVADADFENACNALVAANPNRVPRAAAARIEIFAGAFEPFPAGIALATAAGSEVLFRIGDVHRADIGGENMMAWRLRTNRGIRYAAADQDGISLYEYVELDGPKTSLGVHARSGALLGRATAESINALMDSVDGWTVASAADMLLRRARPDQEDATLSPAGIAQPTSWLKRLTRRQTDKDQKFNIVIGEDVFVLSQAGSGFTLSTSSGSEIFGPVTPQEVESYSQSILGKR